MWHADPIIRSMNKWAGDMWVCLRGRKRGWECRWGGRITHNKSASDWEEGGVPTTNQQVIWQREIWALPMNSSNSSSKDISIHLLRDSSSHMQKCCLINLMVQKRVNLKYCDLILYWNSITWCFWVAPDNFHIYKTEVWVSRLLPLFLELSCLFF